MYGMSFVSFGTHIFGDKTLQFPVHLFKLIMNGQYASSTWSISIIVGINMHGSSIHNRHFVASDSLQNILNR